MNEILILVMVALLNGYAGYVLGRTCKTAKEAEQSSEDGGVTQCNSVTRTQRRSTGTMDDERLCMALGQLGEDHPAWLAVQQVLQEQIDNAVSQVSAPQMAGEHGALAHTAGGIEWLRAAQLALIEARSGARITREEARARRYG